MYLDREFPIKVHKLVNLTSVLDLKRVPCVGNLPKKAFFLVMG